MSLEGNVAARLSRHDDASATGADPGGPRVATAICPSCRGSRKWEEFLPEEVDCMSCDGIGVIAMRGAPPPLQAWPSETWLDEFDIDEAGAFDDGEWLDADAAEAAQ